MAAGFDKDVRGAAGLRALGFGHVEVGTVTAIPQDGNPRPGCSGSSRTAPSSTGWASTTAAPRRPPSRLREAAPPSPRAVIGVNIGKSRVVEVADATADYVRSASLLAPLADYLVVNVSSPNTPGLRGLQAVETLAPLLEAVRDAGGVDAGAGQDRPRPARRRGRGDRRGSPCGWASRPHRDQHDDLAGGLRTDPAVGGGRRRRRTLRRTAARRALEVLRLVRAAVPAEFCVISVGGVETAADVRERLDAGATLVQGYTAFLYRGPLWARQINRGLVRSAVADG